MMTPEYIKEKVKSVIQLPALPAIAMEVVDMVDNPRTSALQLGKVISTDQALTAKVLKIANSPFYGFPKKISTIDFAIIVLGFDALKEIVISISLVSSLQKKTDSFFDVKKFWDHSIMSGVIARRLARDLGYRITGEVFVGALLHDMGISVLHRYFNPEYKRIIGITRDTELTFLEAEESVMGVTHADIGGWLAERWNLPDHLTQSIALHHTPDVPSNNPDLVAIIHCADVMATHLGGDIIEFDKGVQYNKWVLEHLKIQDESVLNDIMNGYKTVLKSDIEQVTHMSVQQEVA
jgi:HD-like signal output (HDOD) protein